MPGKLLFSMLAATIIGAAIQTISAAPAQAQSSCMHCVFAYAQCKRVGSISLAKCEEKRVACVKECKAMDTSASGGSDKAKAEGKSKK